VLIAAGTLVLTLAGQADDGVAAITTAAVMVIAALGPHDAWKQRLIGAAATAVGIGIGVTASRLAYGSLKPNRMPTGFRRRTAM
jgi:hypothetical protein